MVTDLLASCICVACSSDEARVGVFCFIVIGAYQVFFIVLPRIRDINMSGWWLLIVVVPVVNIVFGVILLFRAPAMLRNRPNTGLEPPPTAA